MELESLNEGELLRINRRIYQVLKVLEETEYDKENEKIIDYLAIYLFRRKNESLNPTHLIKVYYESKKISFFRVAKEKNSPKTDKQNEKKTEFNLLYNRDLTRKEIELV